MVAILKNNLNAIIDACKMYHVKSLSVFGSAARENDFTEKSDLDFLVDFALPASTDEEIFYKVQIQEDFQYNLEKITERKIDLIQEQNIKNKYLRYFINRDKRVIYGLS